VRSVLVCVRTSLAAQAITSAATRLGLAHAVRTAITGAEALARLTEAASDVVLADTALTRPDTAGFTRRIRQRAPDAVILFFGPEERTMAQAAVAAGARGLITGGEQEDLVTAVAKALMLLVMQGRVPPQPAAVPAERVPVGMTAVPQQRTDAGGVLERVTARINGAATHTGTRRQTLTERELQVLRGMSEGKSNAEIGRELFVSEDTVKTHARRLFRKLGARDRAHAVAAAFRLGLVN
jgi:DNA-binding NarL/FixJ family response regulator